MDLQAINYKQHTQCEILVTIQYPQQIKHTFPEVNRVKFYHDILRFMHSNFHVLIISGIRGPMTKIFFSQSIGFQN